MDLIFVRHGRPERDDSSADPPLSAKGHDQAARVADYLLGERIDHVVASTMRRAHQTAEPLAQALGLDIELRDDIREVNEGSGKYVPSEELDADSDIVRQVRDDPMSLFDEHGGWDPWKQRIDEAVEELVQRNGGGRVAVFCHGMVMATAFCSATDAEEPLRFLADYTSLFRLKASSSGRRTVVSWNETAHVRDLL